MWTHSHAHAHACAHTYTSTLIYIHTHAHTTHTYVHTYYTHTLVYTHVHRHIHTYTHIYTHTHVHTCTHYTHMRMRVHTLHTCACIHTHTHVPRHIYTHTHSYTHTCTHAHTHTRSAPLILPWAPGSGLRPPLAAFLQLRQASLQEPSLLPGLSWCHCPCGFPSCLLLPPLAGLCYPAGKMLTPPTFPRGCLGQVPDRTPGTVLEAGSLRSGCQWASVSRGLSAGV